jgi:WD repeat-containing protein 68
MEPEPTESTRKSEAQSPEKSQPNTASKNEPIQAPTSPNEAKSVSQGQMDVAQSERKESQVYTYTAPWTIYAMGFSSRPDQKYRIGIGSFLEDIDNKIEII